MANSFGNASWIERHWMILAAIGLIAIVLLAIGVLLVGQGALNSLGFGSVWIVPLKGDISSDGSGLAANFSSDELVSILREADENPQVAAVLLDIDSGGGSVVASKQIVYQVRQMKKPVVSYIGEVGASGAYYVAASSDYIVSDEDSITGSIGVISLIPDFNGLMEKTGIRFHVLQEGKNKAIGNPFTEFTTEQQALYQKILQQAFNRFKSDVLEFRSGKIDSQKFDQIADGRVLTGLQAFDAGLIDETGTKQQAIDKAGELSGLGKDPAIHRVEKTQIGLLNLFSQAGFHFGNGFQASLLSDSGMNSQQNPGIGYIAPDSVQIR